MPTTFLRYQFLVALFFQKRCHKILLSGNFDMNMTRVLLNKERHKLSDYYWLGNKNKLSQSMNVVCPISQTLVYPLLNYHYSNDTLNSECAIWFKLDAQGQNLMSEVKTFHCKCACPKSSQKVFLHYCRVPVN